MVGPLDLVGLAVQFETLPLPYDPAATARTYRAAAATIAFVEAERLRLEVLAALLAEDIASLRCQVATEQAQRLAAQRKLILCKAAAKRQANAACKRAARLAEKLRKAEGSK